jgi:NADP-dependent aldehyde dehydrogenase
MAGFAKIDPEFSQLLIIEGLGRTGPCEGTEMTIHAVLIDGEWRASTGQQVFQATNPKTTEGIPGDYPVSPWSEVETAIHAATRAAEAVRGWNGSRFADFLDDYANRIEQRAEELITLANQETGLPVSPRLKEVELPRTTGQLRQAAKAARDGSWVEATIDSPSQIRSMFGPIGPVVVFGPNNFPFAFNGIAGGDFAAAVAAGNPVIAKAHSSHPATSRLFAELAHQAAQATGMPAGFVQLIYRTSHADGVKLVSHHFIGAAGYTGARSTGLVLKEAADRVGKPIYLELSSINPVYFLPGAMAERASALAEQFATSCLMAVGQFCTNPGLVVTMAGAHTEDFIRQVTERFQAAPIGTLLSEGVQKNLHAGIQTLVRQGATLLTGGSVGGGTGFSCQNTLLRVTGHQFVQAPEALQTEAFGNSSLIVVAADEAEMLAVTRCLEGNLTGSIYSATDSADDSLYHKIALILRQKVGRLLNDKMPTGVAVVPSMNHGGPFPATGHPGFTAVGIPSSIRRFAMLQCYDGVRQQRLPSALQDKNPTGSLWRRIDGTWTQGDVPAAKS